ncbi:hypothetical protein K9M74_05670, partial [Candidatus Woesearchaeota archaeon]|nr:hypothetical protein [Candidatus Woesearchaeota archaeon]
SWKQVIFSELALIVLLLIIAIGVSTFFRMYPVTLPATDQWAEDTATSQIRSAVAAQVAQQFPNLPAAQREAYINEQLAEAVASQEATLRPQIESLSQQFKNQLQDEHGNTYLLAIDPYLWNSYVKIYLGDNKNIRKEGKQKIFELRNGREGQTMGRSMHAKITVFTYKIINAFNKQFTPQQASFYMPVILIALAVIPIFFIGRKIGGNVAGFVGGLVLVLNNALLGRTPAGFSDTDSYIILFPLLTAWIFIESLTAKTNTKKFILSALAGLSLTLFINTWSNGWHIGTILLGVAGIYAISLLVTEKGLLKRNFKEIIKSPFGKTILVIIIFLLSTSVFNIVLNINTTTSTGYDFIKPIKTTTLGPLSALSIKNVASGSNIWPNVLTTVAELNSGSWKQIITSVGGKVFFAIGLLGVLLTFFLKTEGGKIEIRYATMLTLWFLGIAIMGVLASRFISLLAAPFAIAFGVFFGILWTKGSSWVKESMQITKIITRTILVILLLFIFISLIKSAHAVAMSEVPSMNDGWVNSLTAIKEDAEDGVITSWWDFGHWFVNIAERRVTFDGGDQGKRIYWVGKSLMTEDLEENKAILRMLNCGQNKGYERIFEYTNNTYLASKKINEIIYQKKDEAKQNLLDIGLNANQADQVLEKTHCEDNELLDQYYIASQDMVGKAGVWAHFGSWDFDKAFVYNTFRNNKYEEAINILLEKSPYDEDELNNMYYEINTIEDNRAVDTWISPWPNYVTSSAKSCKETTTEYICTINQVIGQQQGGRVVMETATIPKANPLNTEISIWLYNGNQKVGDGNSLIPKKVSIITEESTNTYNISRSTLDYELVIANTPKGIKAIISDDIMGTGAFTRLFFFEGVGMKGYEILSDITDFTGQRIIVYKVNLNNSLKK